MASTAMGGTSRSSDRRSPPSACDRAGMILQVANLVDILLEAWSAQLETLAKTVPDANPEHSCDLSADPMTHLSSHLSSCRREANISQTGQQASCSEGGRRLCPSWLFLTVIGPPGKEGITPCCRMPSTSSLNYCFETCAQPCESRRL